MLAYFLTEKILEKINIFFSFFFKVLDLNLIVFKKETFFLKLVNNHFF